MTAQKIDISQKDELELHLFILKDRSCRRDVEGGITRVNGCQNNLVEGASCDRASDQPTERVGVRA